MLAIKPDSKCPELSHLITFLSHVSKCYSKELKAFPDQLSRILDEHGQVLPPPLRLHMVRALILMRHKGLVEPETLLPLCFRLFECHDKQLRKLLHSFVVTDIRSLNTGSRQDRLNRRIQSFMYKLIEVRTICLLLTLPDVINDPVLLGCSTEVAVHGKKCLCQEIAVCQHHLRIPCLHNNVLGASPHILCLQA
jgi:hypothetical protein